MGSTISVTDMEFVVSIRKWYGSAVSIYTESISIKSCASSNIINEFVAEPLYQPSRKFKIWVLWPGSWVERGICISQSSADVLQPSVHSCHGTPKPCFFMERGSWFFRMVITTSLLSLKTHNHVPSKTPVKVEQCWTCTRLSASPSLPLAARRIMECDDVAVAVLCRLSNAFVVLSLLPRYECVECHFCTFSFSPSEWKLVVQKGSC